jgi:hypothetical protein
MTGSGIDTGEPAVVTAGMRGAGDYRCLTCGYGVVSFGIVPECPMCHGSTWELARPGPFGGHEDRARDRGSRNV